MYIFDNTGIHSYKILQQLKPVKSRIIIRKSQKMRFESVFIPGFRFSVFYPYPKFSSIINTDRIDSFPYIYDKK
jgi:hypothetical protein